MTAFPTIRKKHFVSLFAFLISLHGSVAMSADALDALSDPPTYCATGVAAKIPPRFVGNRFARTELYFGTARPDGLPPVSEAEFQNFLDCHITPAFPDGLTLLKGLGQFRGANGVTIEEDSFLVILLYPRETRRESSEKIEQIRKDYNEEFRQESVLRSDSCCERVGF